MEFQTITKRLWRQPPFLVIAVFGLLDLLGAAVLLMPGMHYHGLSLLDALFTSTSAVCVTGLTVTDTAASFTRQGHYVIMALIQIGGLGVMTISTLLFLTIGQPIKISHKIFIKETFLYKHTPTLGSLLATIVFYTFAAEAAVALSLTFFFLEFLPPDEALFQGIFHSVSAFCNAGFSTFDNGLYPFRSNIGVLLTIMAAIMLGNTGFAIAYEIGERFLKGNRKAWSLNFRLTVYTHLLLLIVGTLCFFIFEQGNALADMDIKTKWLTSLFHSVSVRTAGFNTVEISSLTEDTLYIMLILMAIGACPGSTGGGLKTTTLAALWVTAISRLKGYTKSTISRRTIPDATIQQVLVLLTLYVSAILLSHFLMMVSGRNHPFLLGSNRFLATLFESVSALGTVGLTLDLTPKLNTSGKIIIICTMFIGRVGLLSLVSALTQGVTKPKPYHYASEDIMVG